MAVPRINIKNIDYFKYKKLVIDGVRDDYSSCSKEVKSLCDCVQTLNFRDEEFDDFSDRGRFIEICAYYRQILSSKRIDPLDMRIKSGWWGDHKNAYSAGKLKPAIFKDVLTKKTRQWIDRNGGMLEKLTDSDIQKKMDGQGLFVLKHKEHQCFQYVGRADRIFARVAEKLKAAFESTIQEPLAALIVISMASDWDFYFIPTSTEDDERILRILENDLILKHDTIWPHGLNFRLHIESLVEVSEFRKSCLRHDWPPDGDLQDGEDIDINKLREQIMTLPLSPVVETTPPPIPKSKSKSKANMMPPPSPPLFLFEDIEMDISPSDAVGEQPERPGSGMSDSTYVVTIPISPAITDVTLKKTPPTIRKPIPVQPPRPTSAGKKVTRRNMDRPISAKSGSRPSSARDRQTDKKYVKVDENKGSRSSAPNSEHDEDIGSFSQDESIGSLERSPSSTSLSSCDGRIQLSPEVVPSNSRKPVSRPTSLFKKSEKCRLPTAGVRQSSRF